MASSAVALPISADDQQALRRWANATQASATLVRRTKILLLAVEGVANTEIAKRLGILARLKRQRPQQRTTRRSKGMFEKGNRKLLLSIAIVDAGVYIAAVASIYLFGRLPSLAFIAMALVVIGLTTFIGFYIFSEDMRTAIAATFVLYYLVLLTELLTATKFRESVQGAAVYTTFTTLITAIIVSYFGATAVERATKIIQDGKTARAQEASQPRGPAPPPRSASEGKTVTEQK
jgi:hypothetical protein